MTPTRATAAASHAPAPTSTSAQTHRSQPTRSRSCVSRTAHSTAPAAASSTSSPGTEAAAATRSTRPRKLLLTGAERLDAAAWDKMLAALDAADPTHEIRECWVAKEHVRDIFRATDPAQAKQHLDNAIAWCEHPSAPPELTTLARTLRRWHTEILTAVRTRTSNARTEAANARINHVKRSARGFRNLRNYRLRILLAAGRQPCQTQPVTPIRTRRPSLVA